MSWSPVWWLLAFLPALVALYFLKLKRRDVIVSSTILWRRSVEEYRVNAPFRRLRRNWLLLLQLLVFAGLILAVWRPRTTGISSGGRDLIVLVDTSASTGAAEAGGTRLDLERRAALELVRGLAEGDRVTLLAFSSRTSSLGPATGSRSILESRIKSLRTTALPTDLGQALRVAASIAESIGAPEVHVIGDGCYGDTSALPSDVKRLNVKFVGTGTALENAGITEAGVRHSYEVERRAEVFALVENTGSKDARRRVSFQVEGDLQDAREIDVPAGGSVSVVFDATAVKEGMATISIEPADAFAADDTAWLEIRPQRAVSTLVVGKANPWIELALKANSSVSYRRASLEEYLRLLDSAQPEEVAGRLGADVVIFDREAPPGEPLLPSICIGCHPELPAGVAPPIKAKKPTIIDWDRTHPLHRFLAFTDVYVEESLLYQAGGEYRSLLDSDSGSLAGVIIYRPGGRRAVPVVLIGFDILATNWPLGHYSYPVFFSNALEWLGTDEGEGKARWRTGETLVYRQSAERRVPSLSGAVFRSPSGQERPAKRESAGPVTFSSTEETGIYDLVIGGQVLARYPVSLLDSRESRLSPSARVDFGEFALEVKDRVERGEGELWKWAAAGALILILLEWYVYSRRLG